jgi:hypothetical protein
LRRNRRRSNGVLDHHQLADHLIGVHERSAIGPSGETVKLLALPIVSGGSLNCFAALRVHFVNPWNRAFERQEPVGSVSIRRCAVDVAPTHLRHDLRGLYSKRSHPVPLEDAKRRLKRRVTIPGGIQIKPHRPREADTLQPRCSTYNVVLWCFPGRVIYMTGRDSIQGSFNDSSTCLVARRRSGEVLRRPRRLVPLKCVRWSEGKRPTVFPGVR